MSSQLLNGHAAIEWLRELPTDRQERTLLQQRQHELRNCSETITFHLLPGTYSTEPPGALLWFPRELVIDDLWLRHIRLHVQPHDQKGWPMRAFSFHPETYEILFVPDTYRWARERARDWWANGRDTHPLEIAEAWFFSGHARAFFLLTPLTR